MATDLLRLRIVSDPQPSPDGLFVTFVLTELDTTLDDYHSHVWLRENATGELRQLTSGNDLGARWSPNGDVIAYLGAPHEPGGSARKQLFVMPPSGSPRQLTKDLVGASDLRWSPDGKRIAVISLVPEPESDILDLYDALDWGGPAPQVRISGRFLYRHDDSGYFDAKRRHISIVHLPASDETARIDQLTRGQFDARAMAWHPDGKRIALISNLEDADLDWRQDIWECTVSNGDMQRIVRSDGPIWALSWSPDGRRLAYVASGKEHRRSTYDKLWLYEDATGTSANVTLQFDRSIGSRLLDDESRRPPYETSLTWGADSRDVFFTAVDRGDIPIFRARTDGLNEAAVVSVLSNWTGQAFDVRAGGGKLWFVANGPEWPSELWDLDTGKDGEQAQRTHLNAELMDEIELGRRERLEVSTATGAAIDGWLYLPPGFDEREKYPLVLYVHGGPHQAYGNSFSLEKRATAGRGRIVLLTNPTGSTGYGQRFAEEVLDDWGGRDFSELMTAVDYVVAMGIVDESRMAITGISYGGFMTNWATTHTDRFKTAITEACVSDLISFYGTSDIGPQFMESEFQADPWARRDILWEFSPIRYARSSRTPTLVIHGEADHRCPITQGEEFYSALRRNDVVAVIARFAEGSHQFSVLGRPSSRVRRQRLIQAWFKRYL